jgi:flagellar biosynthesis protein FlhF
MMNTKRFRAQSMREALEQVKHQLGEDALVLDTKRVRAGGILGIGARELIEVRVAVDEGQNKATQKSFDADSIATAAPRRSRSKSDLSILHLMDDAPALPAHSSAASAPQSFAPAFAALAARAYAADAGQTAARDMEAPKREIEKVEINEAAPRLVHRPRTSAVPTTNHAAATAPAPTTSTAATATVPDTSQPTRHNDAIVGELERLRAELREMKFSINAIGALPAAQRHEAEQDPINFAGAEEIYDSPFYETYLLLTNAGLQPDLARRAVSTLIAPETQLLDIAPLELCDEAANGDATALTALSRQALTNLLQSDVCFTEDFFASPKDSANLPTAFAFIGATGVGKTTTIAKLAARFALRERRRVELVTLDTYRIAAVEQLKTYAEIIGAGFTTARSIVELDALTQRFASDAIILIDTTGRNPHDLADQMELADYLRGNADVHKCLVLQATTHVTDALAAIKKFALYGADSLVVTKLDETIRPGMAVQIALESNLPLAYLAAGQRVPEDLECATPEAFAARVIRREFVRCAM